MKHCIELFFRFGRSINVTSQGGNACTRTPLNTILCVCTCGEKRSFATFISIMVKNCIAANSSNTYGHGVSLFKFPKDRAVRQIWIKNVQKMRANWDGPSEHSVLCSQQFESSCFEVDSELAAQMGIQNHKRLKPDAVPTLFDRPAIHAAAKFGSV